VIDFDDAGFGWHQYDMSVALRPFAASPMLAPCTEALVAGYRSVRPFSDDDLAMLPTFQTIRLLVELGWLHTRVAEMLQVTPGHEISRHELMESRIGLAVDACESLLAQ
jgi:Ser/Thr protein kinase RdoA (MazF antagonist)